MRIRPFALATILLAATLLTMSTVATESQADPNLQRIGAPQFTPGENDFARAIQKAMGLEEKGLTAEIEPLKRPAARDLDEYIGSGSTDVAEVSLITPTVGLRVATCVLGSPGHHWSNVACSRHSIGEKGLMVATKVLAAPALDIMQELMAA